MKKLYILFFSLCILTSCSVEVPVHDGPKMESATGTLMIEKKPGGADSVVLNDEEGKRILLSSLAIDLSKADYVGNVVELTGFYKDTGRVFEVTGISVLEVNSNVDKEAALTDFVGSKYGFKLSYFDNWDVVETDEAVEFARVSDGKVLAKFTVELRPYLYEEVGDATDVKAALQAFLKDDLSAKNAKWVVVGASGYDALNEKDSYYFYRNGYVYNISFSPGFADMSTVEALRRDFMTMLATFSFVAFSEDEDVADDTGNETEVVAENTLEMTPFESVPYSFKGMYPKSWYYAGSKTFDLGVLHHYAFSDESVEEDNVKISLDVLSIPMPSGKKVVIDERTYVVLEKNDVIEYYFQFENKVFRVSGFSEYKSLIVAIARSVEKLDLPTSL